MVKIALDAMGGDNAPAEIVKGAVQAVAADNDCFVYLVGKEDKIKECLEGQQYDSSRIEIVNADDVIETGEPPVMAIRRRKTLLWLRQCIWLRIKRLTHSYLPEVQEQSLLVVRLSLEDFVELTDHQWQPYPY